MTTRMDDDEVVATFNEISPARCVELLQSRTASHVSPMWQVLRRGDGSLDVDINGSSNQRTARIFGVLF